MMHKDKQTKLEAFLTDKQIEVLKLVAANQDDRKIAEKLNIQPTTVRKYIQRIYQAFGFESGVKRSRRIDLLRLVAERWPELLNQQLEQLEGSSTMCQANSTNPQDFEELNLFALGRCPVSKFFNRYQELDWAFSVLNNSGNLAIYGESGVGVSSFLEYLSLKSGQRFRQRCKSVYMDLSLVPYGDEDFYSYLCEVLEIEDHLRGFDVYNILLNKPEHTLLFLDNLGVLTYEDFTTNIPAFLLSLQQGFNSQVSLVVGSRQSLEEMTSLARKLNPFLGNFVPLKLTGWNLGEVRGFIRFNLQTSAVEFTEEEIGALYEQTRGHPQSLVRSCQELFFQKKEAIR